MLQCKKQLNIIATNKKDSFCYQGKKKYWSCKFFFSN